MGLHDDGEASDEKVSERLPTLSFHAVLLARPGCSILLLTNTLIGDAGTVAKEGERHCDL